MRDESDTLVEVQQHSLGALQKKAQRHKRQFREMATHVPLIPLLQVPKNARKNKEKWKNDDDIKKRKVNKLHMRRELQLKSIGNIVLDGRSLE